MLVLRPRARGGNREREAEALLNLAQLALDIGRPEPALHGFAAALARHPGTRLALPALGGAARAAAVLGRPETVRWCARRIDAEARADAFAYPTASALLDLAMAFAVDEPARAVAYVQRGLRLSEQFRFHELQHHLQSLDEKLTDALAQTTAHVRTPSLAPPVAPPATVVALDLRGDGILQQIAELDGILLTGVG